MTDHFDRFDAKPAATSASTPMSSQMRESSFDCDTNLTSSIASTAIMPVLLNHSKRKRLDAVLTKLSQSSCKDEPFLFAEEDSELSKENTEKDTNQRSSLPELHHDQSFPPLCEGEDLDKLPQKQLSIDSEMAQECRLMALEDQQHQAQQQSSKSPQNLTHSRVSRESSFNSSSTEHEVTDTTTVMRQSSDNLFGVHRQPLELPRGKLVTRRRVPDTNLRTEPAARLPESGPSSAPPFCASLLSRAYLGLSIDTLPSFPICDCTHCQALCNQASSKMPTLSSVNQSHAWSWHGLKQESPHQLLVDPFAYLLANSKLNRDKLVSPGSLPISQPHNAQHLLSSTLEKHNLNLVKMAAAQSSAKLAANSKKRSHSDSDMTHEYLSLFKSLAAREEKRPPQLEASEPGFMVKNGRRVPKPLTKVAAIHLSSEQDLPLDLSVKYSHLVRAIPQRSPLEAPSSVPLLSTPNLKKPFRFSDSSSAESILLSDLSLRAIPLSFSEHKAPLKRSNISASDSLNSSSLSSISSLSPPYLPPAENKTPKVPRGRFDFIEEKPKPKSSDLIEPESVSSSNHACTLCGQSFLYYDRLAKHIASRHRKSGDSVKNYQVNLLQDSSRA